MYYGTLYVLYFQDAHSVIPNFDTDTSLFAVYDGHGGELCTLQMHTLNQDVDSEWNTNMADLVDVP